MKETTELERKKRHLMKAARTAIRLRHSLDADDEILRRLPELEKKIEDALAHGKPLELNFQRFVTEAE